MVDFSIVIPAYNNIKLLSEALYSVLTQKDVNFEIVIVDDSTNSHIEDFVAKISDERIRFFRNTPSKGAVKNWNYGLSLTLGKYVILLHHDESFFDRIYFLKRSKKIFETTMSDGIVYSSEILMPDGPSRVQSIPHIIKKCFIYYFPFILFTANVIGPTSCVVFRRDLMVFFDGKLQWLVDIDWYYNLFKEKKFKLFRSVEILSNHGHENQITFNIDIQKIEKRDQSIIRKKYKYNYAIYFALVLRNILYAIKRILKINSNPFWKKHENS